MFAISNRLNNPTVSSTNTFTGDGSTTAFTLDEAVGTDEDILVSVDGVIQEPSVAYAVSNGTTLTFTGAPSNNSGNNIFVYYLFRTVATVDHPSTSALSATSGTFSTTIASTGNATVGGTLDVTGNVGLGGANTSSYLQGVVGGKTATIGDGSQASSTLVLKDDDGVFDIATTGGTLRVYDDNNERIRVHSAGAVTIPNQPIFLATAETTISLSTSFAELTDFSNAHVNIGSHYNTSNGRFTAPVAGTYQFAVTSIGTSTSDVYRFRVYKNGSSLNNFGLRVDTQHDGSGFGTNGEFCIVTTLAASDYISIFGRSDGGSDAYANSSYRYSYFRGHLMA